MLALKEYIGFYSEEERDLLPEQYIINQEAYQSAPINFLGWIFSPRREFQTLDAALESAAEAMYFEAEVMDMVRFSQHVDDICLSLRQPYEALLKKELNEALEEPLEQLDNIFESASKTLELVGEPEDPLNIARMTTEVPQELGEIFNAFVEEHLNGLNTDLKKSFQDQMTFHLSTRIFNPTAENLKNLFSNMLVQTALEHSNNGHIELLNILADYTGIENMAIPKNFNFALADQCESINDVIRLIEQLEPSNKNAPSIEQDEFNDNLIDSPMELTVLDESENILKNYIAENLNKTLNNKFDRTLFVNKNHANDDRQNKHSPINTKFIQITMQLNLAIEKAINEYETETKGQSINSKRQSELENLRQLAKASISYQDKILQLNNIASNINTAGGLSRLFGRQKGLFSNNSKLRDKLEDILKNQSINMQTEPNPTHLAILNHSLQRHVGQAINQYRSAPKNLININRKNEMTEINKILNNKKIMPAQKVQEIEQVLKTITDKNSLLRDNITQALKQYTIPSLTSTCEKMKRTTNKSKIDFSNWGIAEPASEYKKILNFDEFEKDNFPEDALLADNHIRDLLTENLTALNVHADITPAIDVERYPNLLAMVLQDNFLDHGGFPEPFTIVPINFSDRHWATLVIEQNFDDPYQSEIYFFDSLGHTNQKKQIIKDVLSNTGVYNPNKIHDVSPTQQKYKQTDGFSCGTWARMATLNIIEQRTGDNQSQPNHVQVALKQSNITKSHIDSINHLFDLANGPSKNTVSIEEILDDMGGPIKQELQKELSQELSQETPVLKQESGKEIEDENFSTPTSNL